MKYKKGSIVNIQFVGGKIFKIRKGPGKHLISVSMYPDLYNIHCDAEQLTEVSPTNKQKIEKWAKNIPTC